VTEKVSDIVSKILDLVAAESHGIAPATRPRRHSPFSHKLMRDLITAICNPAMQSPSASIYNTQAREKGLDYKGRNSEVPHSHIKRGRNSSGKSPGGGRDISAAAH